MPHWHCFPAKVLVFRTPTTASTLFCTLGPNFPRSNIAAKPLIGSPRSQVWGPQICRSVEKVPWSPEPAHSLPLVAASLHIHALEQLPCDVKALSFAVPPVAEETVEVMPQMTAGDSVGGPKDVARSDRSGIGVPAAGTTGWLHLPVGRVSLAQTTTCFSACRPSHFFGCLCLWTGVLLCRQGINTVAGRLLTSPKTGRA